MIATARRNFLTTTASGVGLLALGAQLTAEGLLTPETATGQASNVIDIGNPLMPKSAHFRPTAKSCIFIFMEGGPSQFDLFDPKQKLRELHGQRIPESLTRNVRFAFINKESAILLGSKYEFRQYGNSGMNFSELLPSLGNCADDLLMVRSLHTDQFNHHPAQLLMQCGRSAFGLPTTGSWINYGLGSESQSLPGYVVLTNGRGTSGGSSLWQSGFLPSTYAGVPFRSAGDAVLNLSNPPGVSRQLQRDGLDSMARLNLQRFLDVHDPEIVNRINAYELASRMQVAAPELIDLSSETAETLENYGIDRSDPAIKADRPGGSNQYRDFATNCLLARRLVERGVRFVNVIHATWDHHSNLDVELPFNARMADQPLAALIRDLNQRGLLNETLVVWGSEFGRTPLGENRPGKPANTGRDHHPFAFTILMAGGGLKGGMTYGETDELGWNPVADPVHINDFHATLLHLFGLDHLRLTHRFQGRDFRLTDVAGHVINDWIS